jgi:hypothetical protein
MELPMTPELGKQLPVDFQRWVWTTIHYTILARDAEKTVVPGRPAKESAVDEETRTLFEQFLNEAAEECKNTPTAMAERLARRVLRWTARELADQKAQ